MAVHFYDMLTGGLGWPLARHGALTDPRGNPAMARIRSANGTWPLPANNFAWADGQFIVDIVLICM